VSPLSQSETSFFGSIKLNACWSNVISFKGQILKSEQEYFELCEKSNYVNSVQMTNGLCCIVVREMALVHVTFIQNAMAILIR
jgi:hypothetical protein